MKIFKAILDVVTLLLAIASAVYLVATYGDRIVAWAKGLIGKCGGKYVDKGEEAPAGEPEAAPVEETESEAEPETPAEPEESAEPEAPAEPESFEDGSPVADEADFE